MFQEQGEANIADNAIKFFVHWQIERMENVLRKANDRSITQSFYEKVAQRLQLVIAHLKYYGSQYDICIMMEPFHVKHLIVQF